MVRMLCMVSVWVVYGASSAVAWMLFPVGWLAQSRTGQRGGVVAQRDLRLVIIVFPFLPLSPRTLGFICAGERVARQSGWIGFAQGPELFSAVTVAPIDA